jgi:hypothetical protein
VVLASSGRPGSNGTALSESARLQTARFRASTGGADGRSGTQGPASRCRPHGGASVRSWRISLGLPPSDRGGVDVAARLVLAPRPQHPQPHTEHPTMAKKVRSMSSATIRQGRQRFASARTALAAGPDRCEIKIGFAALAPEGCAAAVSLLQPWLNCGRSDSRLAPSGRPAGEQQACNRAHPSERPQRADHRIPRSAPWEHRW